MTRPRLLIDSSRAIERPAWRAFHVPTRPILRRTAAGTFARLLSINK